MDYGVHTWDIREASGRGHALSGEAADLLVPFMFAIWQGTSRAGVDGTVHVGVRGSGRTRATTGSRSARDGLAYEPGEIEEPAGSTSSSTPASLDADEPSDGPNKRHRARRRRPRRPVPEPLLQHLTAGRSRPRPPSAVRVPPRRTRRRGGRSGAGAWPRATSVCGGARFQGLPEPGDLERGEAVARPGAQLLEVQAAAGGGVRRMPSPRPRSTQTGTATTATSRTSGCVAIASSTSVGERFSPRRRSVSTSLTPRDEREGAVVVPGDEVAGVEPAADQRGLRLLRHVPVARRSRWGSAAGAPPPRPASNVEIVVVDDARLVHGAECGVLAGGAKGAERSFAVPPDQPVRRLRHRVAADDAETEPLPRRPPATREAGEGQIRVEQSRRSVAASSGLTG